MLVREFCDDDICATAGASKVFQNAIVVPCGEKVVNTFWSCHVFRLDLLIFSLNKNRLLSCKL